MSADDPSDDSRSRERASRKSMRFRLIAHGIAWGLFLVAFPSGVRGIETVFSDFGVPLPEFTLLVIRASHVPLALLSLTLVLLGADAFVLQSLSWRSDVARYRSWSLLMIAAPFVTLALTVVSLILPILTVMHRLDG